MRSTEAGSKSTGRLRLAIDALKEIAGFDSGWAGRKAIEALAKIVVWSVPAGPYEDLTERELEVVELLATGMTNQEIADVLVVTEATIRTHVTNMLNKVQVDNRTRLALWFLALDR